MAVGWLLSCVVITAVTLTAVEHISHEVTGNTDLLTAQGVNKQVAEQSASAASAASSTPTVLPTIATGPSTPRAASTPPPADKTSIKPASPSTLQATVSVSAPPPSPSVSTPPPAGTEYVYSCRDGKAVGGQVPTTSPSPSPSGSPSGSPSPSTSVTASVATAPPTSTSSATPSPSTSKIVVTVPGGTIVIACKGNSIANANATTSDSSYTLTVVSTTDPKVDVYFSKT
jgi:hypothetical protein